MPVYEDGQASPEQMPPKDPQAEVDYDFDWSAWLNGDTISTYTLTPATGLTVSSQSQAAGVVTAFLSGGTVGQSYDLNCSVVTVAGRTDQRTMRIKVRER